MYLVICLFFCAATGIAHSITPGQALRHNATPVVPSNLTSPKVNKK